MNIPDHRAIVELGPSIGTYRGCDIPAHIIFKTGERRGFAGIAFEDGDRAMPLGQLQPNECVIAPGLIYRGAA